MYSAWVDPVRRIVSFSWQEGFLRLDFKTHEAMFQHVIALGYQGYAIY